MKRTIGLFSLLLALSFIWTQAASAGLINYDRRNKVGGKTTAASKAPAASTSRYQAAATSRYGQRTAAEPKAAAAKAMPAWMTVAPKASNRTERRYDVNRDGMLQPDEVKRFLESVLGRVESRGGYKINSDVLTPYDINSDGVISRSEAAVISQDSK